MSRRRGLRHEGEGTILINGDLNGDDVALLVLRGGIERLAELHDVDLGGAEGRADRGRRVSGASRNLELDEVDNLLLSHCHSLSLRSYKACTYVLCRACPTEAFLTERGAGEYCLA